MRDSFASSLARSSSRAFLDSASAASSWRRRLSFSSSARARARSALARSSSSRCSFCSFSCRSSSLRSCSRRLACCSRAVNSDHRSSFPALVPPPEPYLLPAASAPGSSPAEAAWPASPCPPSSSICPSVRLAQALAFCRLTSFLEEAWDLRMDGCEGPAGRVADTSADISTPPSAAPRAFSPEEWAVPPVAPSPALKVLPRCSPPSLSLPLLLLLPPEEEELESLSEPLPPAPPMPPP
mmetsp:Transcript_18486/g.51779  ORF Transcript_18486/g.51779 Transcript_18486/m.51779 type:complete len:239 (+) Transcript_18486:385-1101(+)